ncbi:putative F-box protein-like [Capsicum annuum]|nr:putative F-box protein-like [Capsicum annuum]
MFLLYYNVLFDSLLSSASCSAPSDYCASSLMAGTTKRERGSDRKKAAPLKRSKVMGMGVFQDENGFKVLNPGMPSSKICSTGQARVTRSADITGNIDYTPTSTHGADELMTCPSCRTISASSRFNKYSSSGILSLRL